MTAGYDEWAVARTPSLLAFATALVDDVQVADAAVAKALRRTRSAWPRISRYDPDLEARALVVCACSTPRRAAMVLRVLEGRTDAEIAEVLHCSESAARRHLQRGTEELGWAADATSVTAVRDRLELVAGAAPTQLLTRLPGGGPGPHRSGSPRRRRTWLAVVAVLVLVVGVAIVAHESRSPAGVIRYPKVAVPGTWRYESYAGVQLEVPDAFGWGAAPMQSTIFAGPRHLGSCGADQASVLSPADQSSYVSSLTRFVGRPTQLTERCVAWGADGTMPRGEAVWFDSPLAAGVRFEEGNVAETRVVGGQHITVFGPDSSARRQILGTAEQVDVDANGCPTKAVVLPTSGPSDLQPESMSVCVYSQDTGATVLMYSGALPVANAQAYAARAASAASSDDRCQTPQGRWVALGLHGADGTRWDVANIGCGRIQLAGGHAATLTRDTVRDWAVRGVTAYVGVPAGGDPSLQEYLRGPRADRGDTGVVVSTGSPDDDAGSIDDGSGSTDETRPVRDEDAVDVGAVTGWLREHADGAVPAGLPEVRQFPGGASNLTYLLHWPGRDLILRRPPAGVKARGAHDMGREFLIQRALAPVYPYVAGMVALCRDESVAGSDFYVMERIDGLILRKDLTFDLAPTAAAGLCEHAWGALVRLHEVDVSAVADLVGLGRGEGYVARQVAGWTERLTRAATDDLGDWGDLTTWLDRHQPPDSGQCLIHNDWRFDNLVLDRDDDLQVKGVLDWEMATVGDPLMDLGGAVAYWIQSDDDEFFREFRRQPTTAPGMWTRQQVVEWYCARRGVTMTAEQWRFYEAFGLFRLAVIIQQIWYRFVHGQTHNPAYAGFGDAVAYLERRTRRVIGQGVGA